MNNASRLQVLGRIDESVERRGWDDQRIAGLDRSQIAGHDLPDPRMNHGFGKEAKMIRSMRVSPAVLCILVLALLAIPPGCSGQTHSPMPPKGIVDTDYIFALSAANEFLSAWKHRDSEKGYSLLSPGLKESKGKEDLKMDICGVSNPHHQSYEVGNGRRLSDRGFAFDVRLYRFYTNFPDKPCEKSRPQTIALVKVAQEEWRVDSLSGAW